MLRKKLIEELGTKEDGKFPLFNLEELRKLIRSGSNKEDWYCFGRKTKIDGKNINYCIYAYYAFSNNGPVNNCTADCKFYKKLHNIS